MHQIYHDLKHQIATIRSKAGKESFDKYIDRLEDSIIEYGTVVECGNETINIVLTEKNILCSTCGVKFSYLIDGSIFGFMSEMELFSLFGNALDNAIQAVMAEAPENRSVNIRVSDVVGMTQIVFENFCSKPPEMHEGLPKTEKDTQYHGFGLRSIRYIIEKYDGHMSIDTKDQMFILSLLLPRPQQSA